MATVRKFLADLSGQSEARELAKKEAAQLVKAATLKLDALESQLKDLFRNRELEGQVQIVGDRMGAFAREYRVNYEDGNVSDAVTSLVDQIMDIGSEKALKIVCKAIRNALSAMFADVVTSEEEKRIFLVLLEGVALVRYDIYVWRRSEADSGLFKHAESVVAITYARSVVDHTKVSEDELNDAISRSLGNPTLAEVIEYKKELIDLFNLKSGEAKPALKAAQGEPSLTQALEGTALPAGAELDGILAATVSKETAYVNSLCAE